MPPVYALLAIVIPTLLSNVAAVWIAWLTKDKVNRLHKGVNGRMDELLETTAKDHYARGVEAGRTMTRESEKAQP